MIQAITAMNKERLATKAMDIMDPENATLYLWFV